MKSIKTFVCASLLTVAATTFAQPDHRETIGSFEYFEQIDPFTDIDTSFIGTYAVGTGSSYGREILYYRCSEVGFESLITSGYLGSDGSAPVEFRFDKKDPSDSQFWTLSTDGTAVFVPESALATWVAESKGSDTLVVRMTDYNGSTETHNFELDGFTEAIARLSCAETL